jgi:hypothetical protein
MIRSRLLLKTTTLAKERHFSSQFERTSARFDGSTTDSRDVLSNGLESNFSNLSHFEKTVMTSKQLKTKDHRNIGLRGETTFATRFFEKVFKSIEPRHDSSANVI